MTEEDAHDLLDFIQRRLFGWTIAIGWNNPLGKMDGRYTSVKIADRLLRETFLSKSPLNECLKAFERDEDPVLQWPEEYRDFVRFCLLHRCPIQQHEPLLDREDEWPRPRKWPEFLKQYDKPATLDDMPPLPFAQAKQLASTVEAGQTS